MNSITWLTCYWKFQTRRCFERLLFVAWAQTLAPMRPLAAPLVVHDPYFSIWSAADRLTDTGTTHWTGKPDSLSALVRIDGRVCNLTGAAGRGCGADQILGLEEV